MTLGKAPASRSNSTRPRTYGESSSSRVSSKYAPATVATRTQGYAGVAATITSRKTLNYASLAKSPSGSTHKDAVTPVAAAAAATATAAAPSVDGFRVNHSTMYAPHRESAMATPTMPHGVAELGNYSTKGEASAALYGIFKQACRAEGTGRPECTLEENERGLQRCTIRDDTRRRVDLYWTSPNSERWTLITKVEGKSAAQGSGSGGPNGSASSSRELRVTPDSRSTTTAADSNIAGQSGGPMIGTTLVPAFFSGRQGNSVADTTASLEPSRNPREQGKRLRSTSPVPAPTMSSSPPLPRPDRKSAMPIPRDTPRPQLPCVVRNALGAPPFFDPSRVFTADGRSCDEGCRNELALRLCPIILGLAPVPGSREWTQVLTDAEALEYSGQVSNSLALRRKAAKAMMAEYVVTLVLYRGLLLASNHCVLLHGVAELSGGTTAAPAFLAPPTDNGRPPNDAVAMTSVEKVADADRTKETASGGVGTTAGQVPGVVEGEADQDMVNLLLHKHPNDQMNAVLLPAIKTLRNASGRATWLDFESQLRTAAELTFDLDLAEERRILDTTMFRGQRLLDAGGDPKQVLFMFTEKLPNAHGVDRAVLAQDEAALKAIVEASSRLKGTAGGGSGPAAATTHPPFSGAPPQATNGQAAYSSIDPYQGPSPPGARTHIQPVVAYGGAAAPWPPVLPRGQGYGGRPNVNTGGRGGQHALVRPPNRNPQEINSLNRQLQEPQQTFQPVKDAPGAAAAPPPPVLPRGQGYGGRPNVNAGGRGGHHALVRPPNRDPQEIKRLNRQLQELQQTFKPVKDAPTCENCARASRNPNHNHKNCAFAVCRNCKLGGHRLLVCPSLGPPNAPGGGNRTGGGGGGESWQPAVSQQIFQPVQGGPGPTCDICMSASRNPNHHHTQCPFTSCRKCKQGGHRAKVCPARNTVSAPGGGNGAGRGGKTRQPEVLQQTSRPVQGDPGLTCDNCRRNSRDPNHNYKQCPFLVCLKCKLTGHRANACPTRSNFSAPGSGNGTGGGRST